MSKTEERKNLPATFKEQMEASRQKTLKTEVVGESVIKFRQGRMYYRDIEIPGSELDVIVLASTTERSFYGQDYDPDNIVAPDCFALNEVTGDLVPHVNVKEPANDTCKGCALAEFGTAKQGKGPACKTYRRLSVMPASALGSAESITKAELATCRVSPTSVNNWSGYATHEVSVTGMPIFAQVTKVICKPHPKKMHEITFKAGVPITVDSALKAILARVSEAEELVSKPYTYEEAEAAPSKKY